MNAWPENPGKVHVVTIITHLRSKTPFPGTKSLSLHLDHFQALGNGSLRKKHTFHHANVTRDFPSPEGHSVVSERSKCTEKRYVFG